jgi:hypothetical protein
MDTNRAAGPDFGTSLGVHLRKVIGDPSTLRDFRHWFTRALWEAESGNDLPDDIRALAYGIENLTGVLEAGFWNEEQLIEALRDEAAKYPHLVKPSPRALAGTGAGRARTIHRGKGSTIEVDATRLFPKLSPG